jgi:hypothetical protein
MKHKFLWIGLALFLLTLPACAPDVAGMVLSSPTVVIPPVQTSDLTELSTASQTPTPQPSSTPASSPSPTETTVPAPSDSPGIEIPPSLTAPASTNPCENILYPLSAGRQWTYALTNGESDSVFIVSVTAVEGDAASVNILDQSALSHSSATVMCTEGALAGFSSMELGFLFYTSGTSLIMHTTSGLVAPSQRNLEDNNWDFTWTTGLLASGQMVLDDPSIGEIELVIDEAPVQIEWQTAGAGENAFEAVSTRAGTFPRALKVTAIARFDLIVKMHAGSQDRSWPAVLELDSTLWYQPHVGLVKQKYNSSQVLFAGYSYPADITSQIELLEYNFSS